MTHYIASPSPIQRAAKAFMEDSMRIFVMPLQFLAGLLFSMVAGSVFGIWRGYDPSTYSASTFVEMHQGAVNGLNVLLPGIAFVSMALVAALAWLARGKKVTFRLYFCALVLMIAGGIVTRGFNQPINAQVMTWTAQSLPAAWEAVRDEWWNWHVVRTGITVLAMAFLLSAIITDRPQVSERQSAHDATA